MQRHEAGLLEFDTTRLVRIGRPQLDLRPPAAARAERPPYRPLRADLGGRRGVQRLHLGRHRSAPTSCARCSACPTCGWSTSRTRRSPPARSPRSAPRTARILALVAEADRRDPAAGHVAVTAGDILAVMPDCDAMITDVSSVGLDWLYLRTEKPIFITDRHHDAERLRQEVPVSRCADVLDRGRRRRADRAGRRPARARRAPPRPGRDAAPLLRRPAGRRQHDPLPGVGRRALVALRDRLVDGGPAVDEAITA